MSTQSPPNIAMLVPCICAERNRLEAERDALKREVEELRKREAWQPIETAPALERVDVWVKGNPHQLLPSKRYDHRITNAFHGDMWLDDKGNWIDGHVTHWRSLPAPPAAEGEGK